MKETGMGDGPSCEDTLHIRLRFCGVLPMLLKLRSSEMVIEVRPGCTVAQAITGMEIPLDLIAAFAVNGQMRPSDCELHDGDEVAALHALAGG